MGGFSLFCGIANAIPIRVGPFRSDGCTYAIFLRGGEAATSLVRAIRLAGLVQSQDRPADWPATMVALLKETMTRLDAPSPVRLDEWLTSAYLLYWHYADRGMLDDARTVLWRVAMVPRQEALVRRRRYDGIDVVTAVHLALWDGDATTAEQIAAQIPKRSVMRRNSLWFGLEAAILLARGDAKTALRKAEHAQRRLAPFLNVSGINVLEQRWWSVLTARAQTALGQTVTTAVPILAGSIAASAAPVVSSGRTADTLPETSRWLGRGALAEGADDELEELDTFPLPTVIGPRPINRVRQKGVPIPSASVPMALVKATVATCALMIALVGAVIAFAVVWIPFVNSEETEALAGFAMLGFGFAVQVGIAIWIWRQAGALWGITGFLFLVLVFPLYVYKQNRGMTRWETGEPVRKFRTMLTVGALIVSSALFLIVAGAIALHQYEVERGHEGHQQVRVR
jgi:hypothetical protein